MSHHQRNAPTLAYERDLAGQGHCAIAGVDEVGRGAWAGPLVAAAVILPPATTSDQAVALLARLHGVRDSKLLSPARRERLLASIEAVAAGIGIGEVTACEVDDLGLGTANREALRRAVRALPQPPGFLLLDAFLLPGNPTPQRAIVRGDRVCLSIAAASIIAKVTRDRALVALDADYPGYGFGQHKGYGTRDHQAALQRLGPCPHHRRSFAPLRAFANIKPVGGA